MAIYKRLRYNLWPIFDKKNWSISDHISSGSAIIYMLFPLAVNSVMRRTWLIPWWRHQMETFSVLLAICAGNSPATGEFPAQRPVTRSYDVFFDLRLNKRLGEQSWGRWFERPSRPLWRHYNDKPWWRYDIETFRTIDPLWWESTHQWITKDR